LNRCEGLASDKFNLGTIIIDFASEKLVEYIYEINYSKNKLVLKECCSPIFDANLF
jgi:hypothetical protein